MLQFAAVVALVVMLVVAKQHKIPIMIAAAAVMVLMGGPQEFIKAVMAAIPGLGG